MAAASLFIPQLKFPTISYNSNYNSSKIAATASTHCCSNPISPSSTNIAPLVVTKKKRYRKLYPGESGGITEEMRFVAMKLRNVKGKYLHKSSENGSEDNAPRDPLENQALEDHFGDVAERVSWIPTREGFLKFLVDSKLVFDTIERVIDESSDVSYAYFRNTGLERSYGLSKDLEWFSKQNIVIPEPSIPGVSYVKYLEELSEQSAPLFLSHFYNIYFSHIAGGQVITRQTSEKILEGTELEFCKWEGDAEESLKGVREKLNMIGEHWTRDEKNKSLKEATKAFRFMGQIVRLIIVV